MSNAFSRSFNLLSTVAPSGAVPMPLVGTALGCGSGSLTGTHAGHSESTGVVKQSVIPFGWGFPWAHLRQVSPRLPDLGHMNSSGSDTRTFFPVPLQSGHVPDEIPVEMPSFQNRLTV